uniref:Uncharacterized protein n=1 Tax=Arundo donax TaxID=35708 RepID=A0A0A9E293_ARUDO
MPNTACCWCDRHPGKLLHWMWKRIICCFLECLLHSLQLVYTKPLLKSLAIGVVPK